MEHETLVMRMFLNIKKVFLNSVPQASILIPEDQYGPVNAHLRSAAYTNKHVGISWYLTPVQGQMKPLGHFLFSE